MNQDRIRSVCSQIKAAGLDGLLVCPSEELLFLMGFSPMMCERFQGMFLTAGGGSFYVCNQLYHGEISHAFGAEMPIYTWLDGESMTEAVSRALEENGLGGGGRSGCRLGVNSSAQAFNILDVAGACGIQFVNALDVLEEARIIKSNDALSCLRKAAGIADKMYDKAIAFVKPGMSEADIRRFLLEGMASAGGEKCWAIVATGPNSSYPHYTGDGRSVLEKDVVLLDFGCAVNGLYSDMSRTFFIGGISDEERAIYEIVLQANQAGEAAAVEGAFIPDVDAAAREVITAAGYGDAFFNRLGHGIGYMIHEGPDIKKNNLRKLRPGMVFSIEPGIYLAGQVGMRIEDIVAVTEGGNEILNKAPKEMIIV
ncbi:MAG: Xaa-Pro peptidase family protein [Clostridiales bacterium]|nr:Xaa-Pro peptidase family protein [Clostridiales bacterium]